MGDETAFRQVYAQLAEKGSCDAPDGMEYQRVLREWRDAGRPRPVWRFIVDRANVPPPAAIEGHERP